MIDQAYRPVFPIWLRQQLHKVLLNFHWGIVLGQAKMVGDAFYMGVHRDPSIDPKGVGKNHVGSFTGHPR